MSIQYITIIIQYIFIVCKNYLVYLEILRITPILHKVISKLEPPYDKNGRVTPVTGIKPTTTIKLSKA